MSSVFGAILAKTQQAFRQTGRTTEAMNAAPQGALYIWPNCALLYPVQLARHLGRKDLIIKPTFSLINPKYLSCVRPPAMILDHAVEWTATIDQAVRYAKVRGIPVFRLGVAI